MAKHYHVHRGVRKTHHKGMFIGGSVLGFVVAFGVVLGLFSLAQKHADNSLSSAQETNWLTPTVDAQSEITAESIPWPQNVYAAYSVPEQKVYTASQNSSKAVPIASLAKVITALAILKEKPLELNQPGGTITLTKQDSDLFNAYLAKDGVVLPVEEGKQLTQLQALEGSLMVSANNITDTLAIWTFGSVENYVTYANKMLKEMGLSETVVADASGFSPKTISTPEEMTKIGYAFMQHPVLRDITLKQQAELPIAGIVQNANTFANTENIYGIKIGNTDEAGRTYMAARIHKQPDGKEKISVAAVLGAENLKLAADDAIAILKAGDNAQPKQ